MLPWPLPAVIPCEGGAPCCCWEKPLPVLTGKSTGSEAGPDGLLRSAGLLGASSDTAALLGCFFSAFCLRKASSCTMQGATQFDALR